MNRELLSKITCWKEGSVDGEEGKSLGWIEVVNIKNIDLVLGLSSNGYWAKIGKESVYEFHSGQSYMPLYPILKEDILSIKDAIKQGLRSLVLPDEILGSFPFKQVVLSAVNSDSEYWCDLALKNIEQLNYDDDVIDALDVCSKSGSTQRLRHRAKKLKARRW